MQARFTTTAAIPMIASLDVMAVTELGWNEQTGLQQGIAATYAWHLDSQGG